MSDAATNPSGEAAPAGPRPLPAWAWVIAVLFFPPGPLIAFGAARLLPWRRCMGLAIASYANVMAVGGGQAYLERSHAPAVMNALVSLAGMLSCTGWGYYLYCVGRRSDYWSAKGRRNWRTLRWAALFLNGLACVSVGFLMALTFRHRL